MASLQFEYRLPDRFYNAKEYSLLLQKQPGKSIDDFLVDVSGINKVKSYSPMGIYADQYNEKSVRWDTDINSDKTFKINYYSSK